MAVGPYSTTSIGETKLDNLLASYNTVIGSKTLVGLQAEEKVNTKFFGNNPFIKIPYASDTTGSVTTLAAGTHVFLEYGNSDSLQWAGNGEPEIIVLGASNVLKFDDLGSTTDKGDIIVGSDGAAQFIEVNQGKNFVVAGSGQSTLLGGSGADTLVGGGHSSVTGGSGQESLVGGLTKASMDTLVGGSGSDTLTVTKGDNVLFAGSGFNTIFSGDKGTGGGAGGDKIVLTAGGDAKVSIGAGPATDSVYFGGSGGDATLSAAGKVDVLVQSTEVLTQADTSGGTTTLTFQDGQTLTYSGGGHVTVHFNGF